MVVSLFPSFLGRKSKDLIFPCTAINLLTYKENARFCVPGYSPCTHSFEYYRNSLCLIKLTVVEMQMSTSGSVRKKVQEIAFFWKWEEKLQIHKKLKQYWTEGQKFKDTKYFLLHKFGFVFKKYCQNRRSGSSNLFYFDADPDSRLYRDSVLFRPLDSDPRYEISFSGSRSSDPGSPTHLSESSVANFRVNNT